MERALKERIPALPYACFGIFSKMAVYDIRSKKWLREKFSVPEPDAGYFISKIRLNTAKDRYEKDVSKIRKLISDGELYQVNYTSKIKFNFHGCPFSLYRTLKKKQKASYNMFFKNGKRCIASFSPELFFEKEGCSIKVKPMKGTAPRGNNNISDRKTEKFLKQDVKNKSENLMIVDLMRNDLSRISREGSVKVKKLFEIEKYPTLYQMTSTVTSKLKKNLTIKEIIESIFPSGSVTGAPKIRSMEIIRKMEKESRDVYTGAMGYFLPGGRALFNVAIRTVHIKNNKGEMGVGGGIIYDSLPDKEYAEALLKGKFLSSSPFGRFKLLESILYRNGFKNLKAHIKRMSESASFFGFPFEVQRAAQIIESYIPVKKKCRIRVTCDIKGKLFIEEKFLEIPSGLKIAISKKRTAPENIFLYHKTTCRPLYSSQLKRASAAGLYDMVFFNHKGELTEGARTNVYIEKNAKLYTPPLKCGLLNGTVREKLIKDSKADEKIISQEEFTKADTVYISNASVGLRKVRVVKLK